MEDEPFTLSIDIPPILHGYLQRLIASGQFTDEGDAIRHLLRKELFEHVGDPMELRGLVERKANRLTLAAHPKCAFCDD